MWRERRRRSGVSSVNFEHISHFFLVFFVVDIEQVNVRWIAILRLSKSFYEREQA